jgi:serine/threonine protein kinase
VQIKDLNSGTFGFVQLALDKTTGRNVAIKFIERGDKVSGSRHAACQVWSPACSAQASHRLPHCSLWPVSRPGRQRWAGQGRQRTTRLADSAACPPPAAASCLPALPQVTKYVEREIINHRQLVHPHIVQFKEVRGQQPGAAS